MSVITNKWNDGSGDSISIESPSFKGNQTITISSPVQKGTVKRSITFIGKCSKDSSKTVRLTIEQIASAYTYELLLNASTLTIPASGGNSNITAQLKTYRNGGLIETKAVTPTLSGSATGFSISGTTVSASSRGTTVGSERSINVIAKFAGTFDGQEVSANITIKQAANATTSIVYGAITVTNYSYSDIPASGGSVNPTLSYSQTRFQNYTSGDKSELAPITSGGNISYSKESGIGTINAITGAVTANSRGTIIGERLDLGVFKVEIILNGNVKTDTVRCFQQKNEESIKSISGGVYTYDNVVAGVISNKTIPASGGSAIATAGNGTQSWNKSATITTYQYTSGSTKDVTTEAASSGTNNVAPSIASINATASSKGTTVSAQTTVKSQVVTWSANGKSASGTMYIYQEANAIESYNYTPWNITISANPTILPATGGTSTISRSCSRSKIPVYTSGATGTTSDEIKSPALTITTNPGGFTLTGNKLTAANNPIGTKTATVTASYSGATSKSVSVTQEAGPDGIGYMQIQGDGKSHPIFRVGGATRSVEPMSINETSETASDGDVSIFASIKKFLTKFV